jgi:hypothetical protein
MSVILILFLKMILLEGNESFTIKLKNDPAILKDKLADWINYASHRKIYILPLTKDCIIQVYKNL